MGGGGGGEAKTSSMAGTSAAACSRSSCPSSSSYSLHLARSQAALSGESTKARASGRAEAMWRRQRGQGNSRAGDSRWKRSRVVAAVEKKHWLQKRCSHGAVAKPVGPARGSWQRGQVSTGDGGGGEAVPVRAGVLVLGGRAAGELEPEGRAAGPSGAERASSCTPEARGGGAPSRDPPASTPNPWPRDPLGTQRGEGGEPPGVVAAKPPGAREGPSCTPGARGVGATPPDPPASDPNP
jgi:hypothetical protein